MNRFQTDKKLTFSKVLSIQYFPLWDVRPYSYSCLVLDAFLEVEVVKRPIPDPSKCHKSITTNIEILKSRVFSYPFRLVIRLLFSFGEIGIFLGYFRSKLNQRLSVLIPHSPRTWSFSKSSRIVLSWSRLFSLSNRFSGDSFSSWALSHSFLSFSSFFSEIFSCSAA